MGCFFVFEIYSNPDIAKLMIKRQLRNNQSALFLLKSTDNIQETEHVLKEYSNKCSEIYYERIIEKPSYVEVNYFTGISVFYKTLNINDISSDISEIFKNLSSQHKSLLTESFKIVFDECKRNNSSETQIKNGYIRALNTLKNRLGKIVSNLEGDNRILYVGKPLKFDILTFTILGLCGVDVVICDFTETMTSECLCNNRFVTIWGNNKNINLSFLKYVNQGIINTENKTVYVNNWADFKDYKKLEDYLKIVSYRTNDRFEQNKWKVLHLELQGICNGYNEHLEHFLTNLKASNRPYILFDGSIEKPSYDEVQKFKTNGEKDLIKILKKFPIFSDSGIIPQLNNALISIVETQRFNNENAKNNYINNLKILLIRYLDKFFAGNELKEIPLIIAFNLDNKKEEELMILLELLPLDIIYFHSDYNIPNQTDTLAKTTKVFNLGKSEHLDKYPVNTGIVMTSTIAYQAEQEINSILYSDTSLFAIKQFKNINPITIQSTYEEMFINWNEPSKHRMNFNVVGNMVTVPTLFLKVNGVDKNYQEKIKKLQGENTLLYQSFPITLTPSPISQNSPLNVFARQLYFNGEVNFERLIKSPYYTYGFYSQETQQLIIDKVQKLISLNWCNNPPKTLVYDIIDTIFRLPPDILKLIHNYDFTEQIPKLIIYNGQNVPCSLSDAIIIMFLKLIGFDIVIFAPTGYRVIEQYIDSKWFNEYTIGQFDFNMPVIGTIINEKKSFFKKFFK